MVVTVNKLGPHILGKKELGNYVSTVNRHYTYTDRHLTQYINFTAEILTKSFLSKKFLILKH